MNKQKWIILGLTLALMGGTAGLLVQFRTHQKLGLPGVKTRALEGTQRLEVVLPERVLDYESELMEVDQLTLDSLPDDTSFGQRVYKAPDGFATMLNVVLMGRDRTSLHKPQFCLTGQGWNIDQSASTEERVAVEKPSRYDLPVVKLVANKQAAAGGQTGVLRGVYVYWYVSDDGLSASVSGYQRMWWMVQRLFTSGVLQRWAYVSCFAVCAPGQETATFERMKQFIAAATPEFQLHPPATRAAATPGP